MELRNPATSEGSIETSSPLLDDRGVLEEITWSMKSISKSIPVVATACDCEVLAGGGGGGGGIEAECCAI